jgi:hypothetical protein
MAAGEPLPFFAGRFLRPRRVLKVAALLSFLGCLSAAAVALAQAGPNVKIRTPGPGDQVTAPRFVVCGSVRPDAEMTAWVGTSRGEIHGKAVLAKGNSDWSFQFTTDWVLDEDVTLFVRGTSSSGYSEESLTFHWKTKPSSE